MLSSRQKVIKNLALPLALLIFLALFSVDIFFVPRADSSTLKLFSPKDTSISGDLSPRIDSEAAMVVKENGDKVIPLCFTSLGVQKTLTGQALPGELWILLLAAYLFILFFNLFYDFEHAAKIRWFWEGLYTVLTLWGWYILDTCQQNIWFPLYVLKLGSIVYLVYLYLFFRNKEIQNSSENIQEK